MSKQRGFTLIEVMVALMIIAGGLLALTNSWSGSFMRIRKATTANDVATLLERKMIEVEVKYKEKPFNEIPEEETGDFGTDFPQYRWVMKSKELKMPDLTAVLVGQDGGADEMLIAMIKQTTEILSKAIKEVKVSVFAKIQGKEREFSAVQYIIDYSQDFSFGGAGGAGGAPGELGPVDPNSGNGTGTGTGSGTGGDKE